MNEEATDATQKACKACTVEERLEALEEIIDETRKLLTALRRETKQIRTLFETSKEK